MGVSYILVSDIKKNLRSCKSVGLELLGVLYKNEMLDCC